MLAGGAVVDDSTPADFDVGAVGVLLGGGYKTAMGLGQVRLISRFKFFNEINVDYVDNKELLLHYFVSH